MEGEKFFFIICLKHFAVHNKIWRGTKNRGHRPRKPFVAIGLSVQWAGCFKSGNLWWNRS